MSAERVRLTQAQRSMLFLAVQKSGPREQSVSRWQLAVTTPQFSTLRCLERDGYLTIHYGAVGSQPYVKITEAGRAALAPVSDRS